MFGYQVIHVQYSGGNESIPTATVKLKRPDGLEVSEAAASGNGPVDAVFKAIQRTLEIRIEFLDFSVSAISSGSEAVGRVTVQIKDNGEMHEGVGLGTDIIVASAEALIDALNKKALFEATVATHTI